MREVSVGWDLFGAGHGSWRDWPDTVFSLVLVVRLSIQNLLFSYHSLHIDIFWNKCINFDGKSLLYIQVRKNVGEEVLISKKHNSWAHTFEGLSRLGFCGTLTDPDNCVL